MLQQDNSMRWQQRCDIALFWLVPVFLLVDGLNGAILQFWGLNPGISVSYKLTVLLLMLISIGYSRPKLVIAFAVALLFLLVGPAMLWHSMSLHWIRADVQLAIKALSPLIAFSYLCLLSQREPLACLRLCKNTLYFSALLMLINTLAGLAGLGFHAYQPLDGVAQSFLGIKGFFYSTNELSAVLLVLCCAVLSSCWRQHKALYLLCSAMFIIIAALLLTKTGLFGVTTFIVLIPLLLQPTLFWQRNTKTLMLIASGLIFVALSVWLNAEYLLRMLGMYDKLQFVYQQRGISGILLSSRDYYANQIWQVATQHYADGQRLLGVGQGGIAVYLKKYFAEMDWFDLTVFYGLAGLAVFIVSFAVFFRVGLQTRHSGAGRCLLLLNVLLLLVSSIAGHILTSGMLWLPWALCNALLLVVAQQECKTMELR